jgi:DNA replication protein DnaC
LTYKRGIILWGPPGSGKSSTIQIIMKDVVERDGIVIRFGNPSIFTDGMRRFKRNST